MDIKWVPWNTPIKQRLETVVVALLASWLFYGSLACLAIFTIFLLYGNLLIKTIVVCYLIFIIRFDKNAGSTGGRRNGSKWIKSSKFWTYYRNYFPCKLVKTADLPATKNYLFAAFPHGVISLGTFGSLTNNDSNFNELFPKIRAKLATLSFHFYIPIFRELLMWWGMISCSKDSVKYCLSCPNNTDHPYNNDNFTSNAVIIMIGGAQESLNSKPNNYALVLKHRKGFIKIALELGTTIVPVLTFGEVDIYNQIKNPPGSFVRKFQETVKRFTGVAPIFFLGRGFLQLNFGIIPQRQPMTTVVGAPINVEKINNPSIEQINELHNHFCIELEKLFETHKSKYISNYKNVHLAIE